MLWEAIAAAGWAGKVATRQMTIELRTSVSPPANEIGGGSDEFGPLPGRRRQIVEGGWTDERGVSWGQQVGPLNGRAAGPGYMLLESERTPDDLEFGEDMLYAAAARVGWLSGQPDEVVDVPNVEITVSVTPRASAIASSR